MNGIVYPLHFRRNFERRWAGRMAHGGGHAGRAAIPALGFVDPSRKITTMNWHQSLILRKNAANCATLEEKASTQAARNRFRRMADAWRSLAHTQDWLDGLISPVPSLSA